MASSTPSLALRTRSHTVPQTLKLIESPDADLFIQLEQGENKPPMLLHTSIATVKKHFKKMEIEDRKYTSGNPLALPEKDTAAFVLLMKMAHRKTVIAKDVDKEDRDMDVKGLYRVATMSVKYKYDGPLPAWIGQRLNRQLYFDDAMFVQDEFPRLSEEYQSLVYDPDNREHGEWGEGLLIWKVIEVFCLSLALGFEDIFARASRQLTWLLRPIDLAGFDADHPLYDINVMEIVAKLYDAHIELRKGLLANLPAFLYPDQHGDDPGGCRKCNAIPQYDRWRTELLAGLDVLYFLDALLPNGEYMDFGSLYCTFEHTFGAMLLDLKRDEGEDDDKPVPCGRFRVRMSCIRELDKAGAQQADEEADDVEEETEPEGPESEIVSEDKSEHVDDAEKKRLAELEEEKRNDLRQETLMEQVYDSIGGLCLKCFREGECKYKNYCEKHEVPLGL